MATIDFNLLQMLDVLLSEGNVTRAARRLHLSPSAMSRALTRLRSATGDPLLVRAGRKLVPTPRAVDIRERVSRLAAEVIDVLGPAERLELKTLVRTFTLRANEGFVENYGLKLLRQLDKQAPRVRLHFRQKPDKESSLLREGLVDLEIGVIGPAVSPEVRTQALFQDIFVAVVRKDHPIGKRKLTASIYARGEHVNVSRRGLETGQTDDALKNLGLKRNVVTVVGGFSSALALARDSNLIATVPEKHTGKLRDGMLSLALPFPISKITVSLLWHPRMEADLVHRWLRGCVQEVVHDDEPS